MAGARFDLVLKEFWQGVKDIIPSSAPAPSPSETVVVVHDKSEL